jgi:hypothetical protein
MDKFYNGESKIKEVSVTPLGLQRGSERVSQYLKDEDISISFSFLQLPIVCTGVRLSSIKFAFSYLTLNQR